MNNIRNLFPNEIIFPDDCKFEISNEDMKLAGECFIKIVNHLKENGFSIPDDKSCECYFATMHSTLMWYVSKRREMNVSGENP